MNEVVANQSYRMTQLCLVLLGLSVGVTTASARNFVPFFGREQRSLANTFPFNNVEDALPSRETRQGLDNSISSIPFTAVAASYASKKRWVAGPQVWVPIRLVLEEKI